MTADEWLDQAQARCDAATEGPWVDGNAPDDEVLPHPRMSVIAEGAYLVRNVLADDAEFIAAARTDLPRALAALRAVLDLHTPIKGWDIFGGALPNECPQCDEAPSPCATVRAIEEALA